VAWNISLDHPWQSYSRMISCHMFFYLSMRITFRHSKTMGYRTLLAIGFTLASAIKTVSQFTIGHHSRDLSHRICGSSWTWGSRNASMSLTCNLCKWWQKKSVTVIFTSKWDFPGYIQPSYYKISLLFVHILLVFICDRRKLWHMWFIYI
jgi:hypothetical protein